MNRQQWYAGIDWATESHHVFLTDGSGRKIGEKIVIRRFVRFQLGEGLEKRAENFAEEVAKAASGA